MRDNQGKEGTEMIKKKITFLLFSCQVYLFFIFFVKKKLNVIGRCHYGKPGTEKQW